MEQDGYQYIEKASGNIVIKKFEQPLVIPKVDDKIWGILKNKMQLYVDSKNHVEPVIDFKEDLHTLMSGAVNLINFIISSRNKNSIETIFFLDKSARLAAHIFRVLWKNLQSQGKISLKLSIPTIKFINIGSEKDGEVHNKFIIELARKLYSKNQTHLGNILVVDEVVSTGRSLKRALKFLESMQNVQVYGMANFITTPEWYLSSSLKGVSEVSFKKSLLSYVNNLNDEEFFFIHSLFRLNPKLIKDFFLDSSYISTSPISLESFLKKYSNQIKTSQDREMLEGLYKKNQRIYDFNHKHILDYLKSLGGFISSQPNYRHEYKSSIRYRQYLTEMVKITSEYIRIENSRGHESLIKYLINLFNGDKK